MNPLTLLMGGANIMSGMLPLGIGLLDRHRMESDPLLQQAIQNLGQQYNHALANDPFAQQAAGVEQMFGQSPFAPGMENIAGLSGLQGPQFTDATSPLASILGVQPSGQSGFVGGQMALNPGTPSIGLPEGGFEPFVGGPVDTGNMFGPSILQTAGQFMGGMNGGGMFGGVAPGGFNSGLPQNAPGGQGGMPQFTNFADVMNNPVQFMAGLPGIMQQGIAGLGGAQGGDGAMPKAGDSLPGPTAQATPSPTLTPTQGGQPGMTANTGAGAIGGESLLQQLVANPMSLTQGVQDQIFNRGAGTISAGAQDLQRQMRDAAPAGGVQSGALQRRMFDTEMGRTDALGGLQRDIGIEAARTNFGDMMNVAGLQAGVAGQLGQQMLAQNALAQQAFGQNMDRSLGMAGQMMGAGQAEQQRQLQLLERMTGLGMAAEERPQGILDRLVALQMARIGGGGAPQVSVQGGSGFSPAQVVSGGGGGGSGVGDLAGMLAAFGLSRL